ncbi:MAG: GTPase [Candidatus Thorarchaeota archaeon]
MYDKPSLLIIGNSNVGKSSITRLLLPNPRLFKGKIGKQPGSTLLFKPIDLPNLPYKIIDLPGFGFTRHTSRRRGEHIRKQIVVHIEKHHDNYFLGIVVINVLRIEDELDRYFIINKSTIPLSFELIQFLNEFEIPLLIIINKIDKLTIFDKERIIQKFVKSAKNFGINLVQLNDYKNRNKLKVPYLEFSALKKENLKKLKKTIQNHLI